MSGPEVHALAEALTKRWGATLGRFDELDAEDVIEHLGTLGYAVRLIARESSVLELCVGRSHRRGCHHWERLQRENATLRALVRPVEADMARLDEIEARVAENEVRHGPRQFTDDLRYLIQFARSAAGATE